MVSTLQDSSGRPQPVDLSRVLPEGSAELSSSVTYTAEDPKVVAARLDEERKDAAMRRTKDLVVFVVATAAYVGIAILACRWAFDDDAAHLARITWARSIVGALMGGLGGFILGRKS